MKNFLCIENIKLSSNDTLLQIIQSSSEMEGCPITNILESDEKTLWLSTEELPQEIIINIKKDLFKEMPKKISAIGIYCWHAYPTNPKLIEIQISKNNGISFISLGNFDLCLKPGKQLLQFDYELNPPLVENKLDFIIKLIIKETFGDKRTYINNIYLYENINITQKKLMTNMETIKEEDSNSAIYLRESREKIITKNIKEIDTIEENKDRINSDESHSLISDSDLTEKYNNKKNKEINEIKNENIKNNERYNENDNENDILIEMNKQINLMLEKDEMKDLQQENEISSKEKSLNINDFNNEEEENEIDNNNKDNKKEIDENNSLNDIINEENIDLLLEEFENYKRVQEKRMIEYEIKIKNLEIQFQEMTYLNNKMKDTLDTLLESQIMQQNNNQEHIINNMKDIIHYKINNVFNNFNNFPNYNYGYNNARNNYFYNNNSQSNFNKTKRVNNKDEKEILIKKNNLLNRNKTEGNYYNNNYNLNQINDINNNSNNNYQNHHTKVKQYPIKNKYKKMNDINIKKDKYINRSFQKNTKSNKLNKKDNV
jgi:hypothetical protein